MRITNFKLSRSASHEGTHYKRLSIAGVVIGSLYLLNLSSSLLLKQAINKLDKIERIHTHFVKLLR